MVKPEITTEYIAELGAKLGMTGEVNQGDEGFSIQDKTTGATLDVSKATGTINYSVDSKLYPKEKPVLPSDEEARKIAMDFLSSRGLLPEGDIASTVGRGSSTGYGTAHLVVGFTHAVNITGPGSKRGVRIGDGGEVIAVFINPTNPLNLPVEEIAPAKSLNAAYQEIQTGKTTCIIPDNTRKVKITDVKISYWLEKIDKGQEYVIPVYIFGGTCFDNSDKQTGSFMGYVKAVN